MKLKMILTAFLLFSASAGFAKFSNKVNGEYITISGKVSDVKADSFKLKANSRTIHVEMDDYDWDADGYKLVNGDQVVVNGRIDQDFLERKKIEAGSVYVKGINSYFFANSDDEEGPANQTYTNYTGMTFLPENASATINGTVTSTSGRKFTIDTGLRKVTVDTETLIYNPLDKVGYTRISKGDFVKVSGTIDETFFGKKELKASYVVEL
jgi:RNase P/RNase MRP subunit p29